MNFAPYQDESPEIERALSPPPKNRISIDSSRARSPPARPQQHTRSISEVSSAVPTLSAYTSHAPASSHHDEVPDHNYGFSMADRGRQLQAFETSLPMRLDYEAMLAYILLPPAGGVILLLFEHKSDYVRFHAWQGSLLFSAFFVLHLILSWSLVLSWMLFAVDCALIGFLALRAYRDVETLDRFEVPLFGRLASRFVDDE